MSREVGDNPVFLDEAREDSALGKGRMGHGCTSKSWNGVKGKIVARLFYFEAR